MQVRARMRWTVIESYLVVLSTSVLMSCSFEHGKLCEKLEDLPETPLTVSSVPPPVIDEAGVLQVIHGRGCGKRDDGSTMKLVQSVTFAPFVNRATVFLNGWKLRYVVSDHHVARVLATIGKIELTRNQLTWNAIGQLSEEDEDEPYELCYHFTAVGWNTSALSAEIDHDDALTFCGSGDESNLYWASNDGTETALSSYRSYLQNPAFVPFRSAAILPRGFGMGWKSGDDHHVLQLAYNLDHAESFVEHGRHYRKADKAVLLTLPAGAHRVADGYVSWETYAIMKDDKRRRGYVFGEIVSGMAGADVAAIQPPFSILPLGSSAGALGGHAPDHEVVIDNIPYDFAIPMLTGWDVSFANDQHVKEVGVWIDRFAYEKAQGSPVGRLRYTISSRLRDNDDFPGHALDHKVTILALRAAGPRVTGGEGPGGPQLQ